MQIDPLRGRLAQKYIFFEMLPTFLMGLIIFLFIILMFQSFRLMEYIIIHGANTNTVLEMVFYLSISFLPVLLPMSLLFAVLLTYGRLSNDSEIVALKALGLNTFHLSIPALTLSLLVTVLSAQTFFYLGPWGNRQFELLTHKMGQIKPGATIREGVFSEGFFDLVVYTNKINSKTGELEKVFIYDERNAESPLTIIAKRGELVQDEASTIPKAFLRLFDGNIHRTSEEIYTKIDFQSYDINLFDPVKFTQKKKTLFSYTIDDINEELGSPYLNEKRKIKLETEYHRRWALSFACLIFGLLGVALGTTTNKRSAKGGGMVICLSLVITYWILYATFENLAKNGTLPPALSIWTPNMLFFAASLWSFRRT